MLRKLISTRSLPAMSLALFLVLAVFAIHFFGLWKKNDNGQRGVIRFDVISYYSYLPASVIYKDVSLDFIGEGEVQNDNKFWYVKLDNGRRLIVTSMGLSFMYAPFFFIAHLLANPLGQAADGYSNIYQLMLLVAGCFYAFMGLLLLNRFLKRFFHPPIRALILLVIGLGTNLFYYSTKEAAMPHSFNFFLITLFIILVPRWYEKPGWKRALSMGFLFGFIALVRPSNILLFLFLFFYGVKDWKSLGERVLFYLQRWPLVLLMLGAFFLPWIPQFLYWKELTGQFFFFSYAEKGATFYFAHPHIWESLFSFRKGWLLYTPLMTLGLVGIAFLRRDGRPWFLALLLYVPAMIWVQSSWWCWWFGGGFSLRPYVSMYPLLALPMGFLFRRVQESGNKVLFPALASLVLVLTAFQLFQTRQFTTQAIHYSGTTAASYKENFLKLRPTHDSWQMLELPDFNLARLGIHVAYPTDTKLKEGWRSLSQQEAYSRIEEQIRSDAKLQRQIERYAQRDGIAMDSAMQVVLKRMHYRLCK